MQTGKVNTTTTDRQGQHNYSPTDRHTQRDKYRQTGRVNTTTTDRQIDRVNTNTTDKQGKYEYYRRSGLTRLLPTEWLTQYDYYRQTDTVNTTTIDRPEDRPNAINTDKTERLNTIENNQIERLHTITTDRQGQHTYHRPTAITWRTANPWLGTPLVPVTNCRTRASCSVSNSAITSQNHFTIWAEKTRARQP